MVIDNSLIKKEILFPATASTAANRHEPLRVINRRDPEQMSGQVIGRIAGSHYYIRDDVRIDDLLKELNGNPAISSVGVVDNNGTIAGVITRDLFFDILGRPFGRDLYKNKRIDTITFNARHFKSGDNIFSVAEEISSDLMLNRDVHYVLTDNDDRFFGVFTNRDLLIYLSYLTTRDLGFAKNVQSCIINDEMITRNERCDILAATKMAKDVGGDYYTVRRYGETNWFIAVCDVAGKGISAALLSVLLGGINHVFDFGIGVRRYVEKLNDYIYASLKSEKFITGVFADFDDATGQVKIFDAGHSFIFLVRRKKVIHLNGVAENLPIGVSPVYNPVSYRVKLKKNDILVIYTDGIEEQRSPGGAPYGPDRVRDFFTRLDNENLKIIKDSVFHDIRKFRNGQTQDDDMTLFMLRYLA